MSAQQKIREGIKRILVLNSLTIVILIAAVCLGMIAVVYYSQKLSEQTSLPPIDTTSPIEQYQIAKLAAEIRQIRSDTSGSLFWLKMIALFVTVGGAVGGYLVGQSHVTKKRIEFENRKNIDSAYQSLVQELSDNSTLLRAAAAVKLGMILRSFPAEWTVDEARKEQLIQLTKQVLAASLAIEEDQKVLKTLSIALVLHKRWENDPEEANKKQYGDGRELDLSGAKAEDAYWAKVDFSYADFFRADLTRASFRGSILQTAQFCQSDLEETVLAHADCQGANFKLTVLRKAVLTYTDCRGASFLLGDLRDADLANAKLQRTSFENAKVHGCKIPGAEIGDNPNDLVDDSAEGDGTVMIRVQDWLERETGTG